MNFKIGTLQMPLAKRLVENQPFEQLIDRNNIQGMLREALANKASDIHLNVGHPVIIETPSGMSRLTSRCHDSNELFQIINCLRGKEGAGAFLSQGEDFDTDFKLIDANKAARRLRVNITATTALRNLQSISIVLRPMQDVPPMPNEVGLSQELVDRLFPEKGAVYVIGPTGSGKTTTFASLFKYAAVTGKAYHGHLATYEAPPEYDLESLSSKHLLITQTAIHSKWGLADFADGIRNALRRHPAAIMIGEVRDHETVQAVVEASLTGHPVFATVHADNPAVAFQRLLSRFPAALQNAGLYDLIMTTEAIVAQRLVPGLQSPRVAVREWLIFNDALRQELLSLENSTRVIAFLATAVSKYGVSFAQNATSLYQNRQISEDVLRKVMAR